MGSTSGHKESSAGSMRSPWMRRLVLVTVVAISLGGGASPSAASIPDAPVPPSFMALDDNNHECRDGSGDLVPAAVSTEARPGDEIALDVLFLLDGVTKKEARAIITAAQGAYDPIEVTLKLKFKRFPITPDGVADDGQPTADFIYLLDEMRRAFPITPEGFDVVHLITAKDVIDPHDENRDGTDALAGVARCVGGIRYEGFRCRSVKPSTVTPTRTIRPTLSTRSSSPMRSVTFWAPTTITGTAVKADPRFRAFGVLVR